MILIYGEYIIKCFKDAVIKMDFTHFFLVANLLTIDNHWNNYYIKRFFFEKYSYAKIGLSNINGPRK